MIKDFLRLSHLPKSPFSKSNTRSTPKNLPKKYLSNDERFPIFYTKDFLFITQYICNIKLFMI